MSGSRRSVDTREMGPSDLERVLAIEAAVFSNPWQETDFQFSMEKPTGDCLVAESEGGLVGYSVGFLVGKEYHLADFAIDPLLQRKGLGTSLLTQIVSRARAASVGYITLELRISNTAAAALYGKSGFSQVAIRSDYYRSPKEDALVMLKVLEGELSDWLPDA